MTTFIVGDKYKHPHSNNWFLVTNERYLIDGNRRIQIKFEGEAKDLGWYFGKSETCYGHIRNSPKDEFELSGIE